MNLTQRGALDAMLDALREAAEGEEREDFNRTNVVGILRVLVEHLAPLLEEPLVQDEEVEVVAEHTAVYQLRALVSALRDLDAGLKDPIFDAYEHGANATLRWPVRECDAALIEALGVYQKKYGLRQLDAAKKLATDLTGRGFRRKGKPLTGNQLRRLKYPSTKRTK